MTEHHWKHDDPGRPLDYRERKIVRGMIDEYEYKQHRSRYVGEWLGDAKTALLALAAVGSIVVQIVGVILHG